MPDGCLERRKLNSDERNGRNGESQPVLGMTRAGEFYWRGAQVIIQMRLRFHSSEM